MKEIGGYFSLELSELDEYHEQALRLNTGRSCLEYILCARGYKAIYIPYYTCDVVLEPILKRNIKPKFYHIDDRFEIVDDIELGENEGILYTNYWGLNDHNVITYARKYKEKLIVDNTQAFYSNPVKGVDSFYSCRKFFGVPDGAYLYSEIVLQQEFGRDVSYNRLAFLTKRIDISAEAGYEDFKENDRSLSNCSILRMSAFTQRMMCSIDYESVKNKRLQNFQYLHSQLRQINELNITIGFMSVPMVYPLLIQHGNELRTFLINNKIFVAKYWPNVVSWVTEDTVEYGLTSQLVALPIDQRYGKKEMERIIQIVSSYLSNRK